jgi:hypothetical protein
MIPGASLVLVLAVVPFPQERFPLGPLGGTAAVTAGEARAVLVEVEAGGLLAEAGLREGDALVAVGAEPFVPHSAAVDAGGSGPQRALGEAVDRAGDGSDDGAGRRLVLGFERDGVGAEVGLVLPPRPAFGGPRRAEARAGLRRAAAAQLLASRHADGFWDSPVGLTGDRVITAWALLALLAHGDPAQRPAVDAAAAWLRGPDGRAWLPDDFSRGPDSLDNWALAATSIALAEHRAATGDEAGLPVIARCNAALAARMDAEGRMGHDVDVGYGGKGFNVINAQAQLAWALGARVGVPLDEGAFGRSLAQLAASIDEDGGVRYWTLPGTGTGDASLRSGCLALALSLTGRDPDLHRRLVGYLDAHAARAREAHAVGSLGMLVQAPALRAVDEAAYERFLAEWRWYLALAWGAGDRVHYIGGKGNNGGDSYLGFDQVAAVIALQLLAVGDGRLAMLRPLGAAPRRAG